MLAVYDSTLYMNLLSKTWQPLCNDMIHSRRASVVPRNVQHDARPEKDGSKLHERLAELGRLVGPGLEQLGDDGDSADVEEGPRREGQQHVAPGKARAPETITHTHGRSVGAAAAAEFLHGDADEGANQGPDGRDELGAHGLPLGEARLHEQGKVADLVRDLVEEDGHGGGGADGGGCVERGRHGEAVGDVVRKVGAANVSISHPMPVTPWTPKHLHHVQQPAQLHRRVHFLLHHSHLLRTLSRLLFPLPQPRPLLPFNATRLPLHHLLMPVPMPMRMLMPHPPSRNPQPLIHRDKHQKPHQNRHTKQQIPIRLHQHQPRPRRLILAQKDLRQQMKQGIAQQPADGKRDHDGQRGGVDVGGAEGEQEVGRAGDVEGCEQGVDARVRGGEEDCEEAGGEGGGGEGVSGGFGGGEGVDDGAGLVWGGLLAWGACDEGQRVTDLELGVELFEGEVVQRRRRGGIGFGGGAGPRDLGEEGDGRDGDDGRGAGAPEREEGHCDAVGRVCGWVRLGNRRADDGGKRRESSRGVWIQDHARGS